MRHTKIKEKSDPISILPSLWTVVQDIVKHVSSQSNKILELQNSPPASKKFQKAI